MLSAVRSLADPERQHAVGEVGRDVVTASVRRPGEGARETAVAALGVVGFLIGALDVLLAGDRQHIVLDKDLHVLLVDTRQLDGDGVCLAVLLHLDPGRMLVRAECAHVAVGRFEQAERPGTHLAIEELVELAVERRESTRRRDIQAIFSANANSASSSLAPATIDNPSGQPRSVAIGRLTAGSPA